jgi:hypothetical protein
VSFTYRLSPQNTLDRDGPIKPGDFLTTENLCLAQFCVDGYSDEEIGVLLGCSTEGAASLVAALIECSGAHSKTGACIRALKSKLVV